MGSSYRGLQRVASFRPYTSKQVGDTGPAESARRSNSRSFRSSFSEARGTLAVMPILCGSDLQCSVCTQCAWIGKQKKNNGRTGRNIKGGQQKIRGGREED